LRDADEQRRCWTGGERAEHAHKREIEEDVGGIHNGGSLETLTSRGGRGDLEASSFWTQVEDLLKFDSWTSPSKFGVGSLISKFGVGSLIKSRMKFLVSGLSDFAETQ